MVGTPISPQPRDCGACGARASQYVIESRTTADGCRRRRYECSSCAARETTYELSSAAFDQLRVEARALERIRQAIDSTVPPPLPLPLQQQRAPSVPCSTCIHAARGVCSIEIPEAFTTDAIDCSSYIHAD